VQPSAPHKEHNATAEPKNLVAKVKDFDVKQVQAKSNTSNATHTVEQVALVKVDKEVAQAKANYAKDLAAKEADQKEKALI
jgi:hypothetical protein